VQTTLMHFDIKTTPSI